MNWLTAVLLVFTVFGPAAAQTYGISTFAGGSAPVNAPGPSASLGYLQSGAVDSRGNLFFTTSYSVMRLDAVTGSVTTVAGNGTPGYSGDNGPATGAQLTYPSAVAVDATGNLFIGDESGSLRKVSNGVITTVIGLGTTTPVAALAVDSAGNLYIAYNFDRTLFVLKVSNGVISKFWDGGSSAGSFVGPGPIGLAIDSADNVYIGFGAAVFRVSSSGISTRTAGTGTAGFSGDGGAATGAQLNGVSGLAFDSAGNFYIIDVNRIRKVSSGIITTVAGNGTAGYSGEGGPATSAQLAYPDGVAVDSAGNIYVADLGNNRIRKVSNGVITTAAGNGTVNENGDGGPAKSAQLNYPNRLALDSFGDLYIADLYSRVIRKVSNGIISTVAGGGTSGLSGDGGPAISAQLSDIGQMTVDSAGTLYIADSTNNRVRKVSNGIITTVAGNGTAGYSGDGGIATSAQLRNPGGIAVDTAGNLYIADTSLLHLKLVD